MRSLAVSFACAAVLLAAAAPAFAEKASDDPVEKRFQSLEKQVKQLKAILTQARDTGQAVTVRLTSDPDPAIESLQMRVDDLEAAAQSRNGQIDALTHDLDLARKDAADAKAESKALGERLAKAEARLKELGDAATAEVSGAASNASTPEPLTSATRAPAPAATQASDPDVAYKRAMQLLLDGHYPAAQAAFSDFVETFGDTPNGPEARYWLAETLYIQNQYADAATNYIGAIRGWPQTAWAPDAVVKLARALVALNKPADACHTLDEFARRYPAAAPPVKAKAANVRAAAKCGV